MKFSLDEIPIFIYAHACNKGCSCNMTLHRNPLENKEHQLNASTYIRCGKTKNGNGRRTWPTRVRMRVFLNL